MNDQQPSTSDGPVGIERAAFVAAKAEELAQGVAWRAEDRSTNRSPSS